MKKVLNLVRSSNLTRAYLVTGDDRRQVIEVWQVHPEHNHTNVLCKSFRYSPGECEKTQRQARGLATALSRMSPSETMKQAENIRLYGEVR